MIILFKIAFESAQQYPPLPLFCVNYIVTFFHWTFHRFFWFECVTCDSWLKITYCHFLTTHVRCNFELFSIPFGMFIGLWYFGGCNSLVNVILYLVIICELNQLKSQSQNYILSIFACLWIRCSYFGNHSFNISTLFNLLVIRVLWVFFFIQTLPVVANVYVIVLTLFLNNPICLEIHRFVSFHCDGTRFIFVSTEVKPWFSSKNTTKCSPKKLA